MPEFIDQKLQAEKVEISTGEAPNRELLPANITPVDLPEDKSGISESSQAKSSQRRDCAALPLSTDECSDRVSKVEYRPFPETRKKTNFFRRNILVTLSFLPLALAALCLLVDRAAWPTMKAEYFDHKEALAIADYSQALKIRRDPEVLLKRADVYEHMRQQAPRIADLQEAVALGINDGQVIYETALARVQTVGIDEKTRRLLRSVIEHHKVRPFNIFDQPSETALYAGEALIAAGDYRTVFENSQTAPYNTFSQSEQEFFKGIAYRELGQVDKAESMLKMAADNPSPYSTFEMNAQAFRVFLALDRGDVKEAAQRYKDVIPADGYGWNSVHDSVQSWLLYQKGYYKPALAKANQIEHDLSGEYRSIVSLNALASAHLLKAHIYLQQHKNDLAAVQFELYKQNPTSGKILIPKPYRKWINKVDP